MATIAPTSPLPQYPPSSTNPALGVGQPLWWVYRLENRLRNELAGSITTSADGVLVQNEPLGRLDRYFHGHFDLPWITDQETANEYNAMLNRSRSNFMRMLVEYESERIRVQGLRLPGDDEPADSETWEIWLRNDMDHWSPIAFTTALRLRRSFLSVWWDQTVPAGENKAKIALEDPLQTIVEYDPSDRTRLAAAAKFWIDDWTGTKFCNLWLDASNGDPATNHFYEWRRPQANEIRLPEGWYLRREPELNPLGVVPIVPIINRPDMYQYGYSEIDDAVPVQDRYNQTIWNNQIAEHLDAFRQKWATGMEIPKDPETGDPISPYRSAIEELWVGPEKGKFGQFDSSDLRNYHMGRERDLEDLSILTRTPRHVFMHQGQAPSGDAMKSDEVGFIGKVRGTQAPFGSGLRQALGLARQIEGLETPLQSEVVWMDPEFMTFGQLVDGGVKLLGSRVWSRDYFRERLRMRPSEIQRVKGEVVTDILEDAILDPEVDAPVNEPAGAELGGSDTAT